MEFNKMCEYVDYRLNLLSLEQKITVFHDILNCPVRHTLCKYYYQDQEWDEFKMKDFCNSQLVSVAKQKIGISGCGCGTVDRTAACNI